MPPSLPPLSSLPEQPKTDNEPVFQAPWEAKAFAIVNQLVSKQHWNWPEWTNTFAQEISAAESDATDTSTYVSTYYERWVNVCEKLLVAKGILDLDSIDHRIKELLIEAKIDSCHTDPEK